MNANPLKMDDSKQFRRRVFQFEPNQYPTTNLNIIFNSGV